MHDPRYGFKTDYDSILFECVKVNSLRATEVADNGYNYII